MLSASVAPQHVPFLSSCQRNKRTLLFHDVDLSCRWQKHSTQFNTAMLPSSLTHLLVPSVWKTKPSKARLSVWLLLLSDSAHSNIYSWRETFWNILSNIQKGVQTCLHTPPMQGEDTTKETVWVSLSGGVRWGRWKSRWAFWICIIDEMNWLCINSAVFERFLHQMHASKQILKTLLTVQKHNHCTLSNQIAYAMQETSSLFGCESVLIFT